MPFQIFTRTVIVLNTQFEIKTQHSARVTSLIQLRDQVDEL